MWQQLTFYVSYMTWFDFQEIFSTSVGNQNYTVLSLWKFFYDPCMISRKPYMVLVWLPRIHTNHIWPIMITKNHIWTNTKSKKLYDCWPVFKREQYFPEKISFLQFFFALEDSIFLIENCRATKMFSFPLCYWLCAIEYSSYNWDRIAKKWICAANLVWNNNWKNTTLRDCDGKPLQLSNSTKNYLLLTWCVSTPFTE